MRLGDLLGEGDWEMANCRKDTEITGLALDSRKVKPGYLFAALSGSKSDGATYVPAALTNGALAVLVGMDFKDGLKDACLIKDTNPRKRLSLMAARFYENQPKQVVAVTGTNGKTSVVNFTRQLWEMLGLKAASLGTLGLSSPALNIPDSLTTPDPLTLHQNLAELASGGVTHLAMEASSHGLDQYRLDGVKIKVAAFTNLSRDHLDYHKDMGEYFRAKARLFAEVLAPDGVLVLNADVPEFPELFALRASRKVVSYGHKGEDIRLIKAVPYASGQKLRLAVLGQEIEINLPLAGEFQAMNALCALGILIAEGEIGGEKYLEKLKVVPGRMQLVASSKGAGIYVDYAHSPDALATVLKALRPHCQGKLRVVFGCGGNRDAGKRPLMGKNAASLADDIIITDDNPRHEEPALIRKAILNACPSAQEIPDREKAIKAAVDSLGKGDILLIAGKGHERGQIIGDTILPFDDAKVVKSILGET